MNLAQRISAFHILGDSLRDKLNQGEPDSIIQRAYNENQWFTPGNIRAALEALVTHYLNEEKLEQWMSAYKAEAVSPKTVGIVMAGNIPLVGWHDLMSVLITGHKAMVKLSAKDTVLPKFLIEELSRIAPELGQNIIIADRLKDFDAVIATGSGNTARYFEYYFGRYPHIIRKNRTSVAIFSGAESDEELYKVGEDIFAYFGLGCRNVSKLYVPRGYNFTPFFEAVQAYNDIVQHSKYQNNYLYYKSLYLLNKDAHLDNGFVLLKESEALASPVATLYYENYDLPDEIAAKLAEKKEEIQCVVGSGASIAGAIPFGQAQQPELWDYADNVDTVKFLLEL